MKRSEQSALFRCRNNHEYVGAEALFNVPVLHAEKIASEKVFDNRHDVWDLHAENGRWWIVTGMTNLYSQDDFKSMDVVLSFHIGLTARLMASSDPPHDQPSRMTRAWRQWHQAADAQSDADEAEEFQAVGMRCREALLSFVHDSASDDWVPDGEGKPKHSDFIHWTELIANGIAAGSSAAAHRSLLKATAKEAWQYVSWLTHGKNATPIHGGVALQGTAHVLALFGMAMRQFEAGGPERCPNCASYRVTTDEWFDEEADLLVEVTLCPACGWQDDPDTRPADLMPEREPPEGDCVTSSDISTTMTLDSYKKKLREN